MSEFNVIASVEQLKQVVLMQQCSPPSRSSTPVPPALSCRGCPDCDSPNGPPHYCSLVSMLCSNCSEEFWRCEVFWGIKGQAMPTVCVDCEAAKDDDFLSAELSVFVRTCVCVCAIVLCRRQPRCYEFLSYTVCLTHEHTLRLSVCIHVFRLILPSHDRLFFTLTHTPTQASCF